MGPVLCDSCGVRFPVSSLTEDECRALQDQHYYQELAEELRMLRRVQEYYRRHPGAEGRIKPHFDRLLESDDPEVMDRLCAGVPFDQIELTPESLPAAWVEEEDREIVQYLRHNSFSLGPRLESVSEGVARFQGSVAAVACPRCQVGRLRVPPENWHEFNIGDAITWVRPHWHNVDADGTLHVKASGWQGDTHWTGERTISPTEAEYEFLRWLVAQKEYNRLLEETELPAIREEWARRRT